MTAIHWLNAINGSFTNPTDWVGGTVPGTSDDAILDAVGSAFTVTSGVSETVESVQLAPNATLSLTAGTFTARDGTGSGANAGVILIGAGASMQVGQTVINTGTIELDGSSPGYGAATLKIDPLITTLMGGGEVLLGGNGSNTIEPSHSNSYLYNVDNTIIGAGAISNKLSLANFQDGVIDADAVEALVVRGTIFNNVGLVEATGSGGLIFQTGAIGSGSTGIVLAGNGSKVQFINSRVSGGTFETTGSGKLIGSGTSFFGEYQPVILDGKLKLSGACEFGGTIVNNSTIALSAAAVIALVDSTNLKGEGGVDLAGHIISAANDVASLSIDSGTLRGGGTITGSGWSLPLTLNATAVIEEYGTTALTLMTHASINNAGTIASSGAGGIVVDDAIVNNGMLTIQGGGTFAVEGAVSGKGKAIVGGGTLEFLSGFNEGVTFSSSGTLVLAQSQGFTNSVKGFSEKGKTTLDLGDIKFIGAGEASFSGTASGGVLTVTDGTHMANISLKGDFLGATFVASSDGLGGTNVVATSPQTPLVAHFVSAMAAMNGHGVVAGRIDAHSVNDCRQMMLAAPRLEIA